MIFHRLKSMNKKQSGFTLVEIIIAVAIAGLIISAATGTIFQVFTMNARDTAHMIAVKQVENAVHWISRDIRMAQTAKIDDPAMVLALTWVEWNNTENQVTYTLDNGDLRRNHSVNGQTIVAQHIESIVVAPKPYTGGKLAFTITATLGGLRPASETRVVEVMPRPGS